MRDTFNNSPKRYVGLHEMAWKLFIKEVGVDNAAKLIRAGKVLCVKVEKPDN